MSTRLAAGSFGRTRRERDEQGSVTLWFVVMTIAFFVIVGLVVDGGGKIRATQEADAIAREAARAAGQALARDSQAQGAKVLALDTTAARAAAHDYLRSAGATGSVSVQDATITMTATITYQPVFLTALGPMAVTGTATARTVRAFEGEER